MALQLNSATAPTACPRIAPLHTVESSVPRITSLDALRGLAALAVFVYHALAWTIPNFEVWNVTYADLGSLGVAVFFVISGYIIPISLERQGLRSFWIRRICRIYPLYWWILFCSACFMVITHTPPFGKHTIELLEHPISNGLTNALLLQFFFNQQNIVLVAWTLQYELLFYVVMSLLLLSRLYNKIYLMTSVCLSTALLVTYISDNWNLIVSMLLMFTGLVIRCMEQGRVSRCFALSFGLLAAFSLPFVPILPGRALAMGLGIPVFGLCYLLRRRPMPSVLLFLGRISYSIYLLHFLVVMTIPAIPGHILPTILLWGAVVIGISTISERLIERPAIELGRRLSHRSAPPI